MRQVRHSLLAFLAVLFLTSLALADDLGKLRGELQRESDPVERAKLTAKLGDELLKLIAIEYKQEKYKAGEQVLGEYMEAVRTAYRGLQASGRNARQKPAGFKHLEIHLRKSGRILEDVSKQAPEEQRERLQRAVGELAGIRAGLLEALMQGNPPRQSDI